MNIYLVRHTTPNVAKGICYGQADLDVSHSFEEEVNVIKEHLVDVNFDVAFSSPLKRCKLLAEKLYTDEIIFDRRMMEMDFGDWELKDWNEIPKAELDPWMEDFVNKNVPNGESFIQLAERVMDFWRDLQQQNYQNVLVSSHSAPIRTILMHESNQPLKNAFKIKLDYGDVRLIEK